MDNFIRGKVLGKGSFGCAVLVTSKKDGKNYVIKEIDISRMPAAEREASKQEARLLMALQHPNIVKCTDTFTELSKLCIVMDWCSEGDLHAILQKKKPQQLSEDTILDWFVQICLGLKHVHDRKILHRDIKTQNIFMSAGGLLKLGDFGVSKILNSTWQLAATAVGTPYYLSPEICQNKKYNQKSDIWSLGCVLYELATMKHAFEAPNMRALIQKIIKASYNPIPSSARSKELRDLIDRMLTLDWQKRPSINDVLATPIMKARIQKFLSATLHAHEFSHTIIHGKPKAGQLVVAAALPAPAFAEPKPSSGSAPRAGAAPGAAPAAAAAAAGARAGAGSAAAHAVAARGAYMAAPPPAAAAARQAPMLKGAAGPAAAAAARLAAPAPHARAALAHPPSPRAGAVRGALHRGRPGSAEVPAAARPVAAAGGGVRLSVPGEAVARAAGAAAGIRASSPAVAAAALKEKEAVAQKLKEAAAQRERAAREVAAIKERAAAAQRDREAAARREKEAVAKKLQEAAAARERAAALQRENEVAAQRAREAAAQKMREAAAQKERDAAEQRAKLAAAQRERAEAAAKERAAAAAREREAAAVKLAEAAAARERDAAAQKQREAGDRDAAAEAMKRQDADVRKARELAAMGAHREVERMKLEEQRKRLEQDCLRMDADKRQSDVEKQKVGVEKRAEDAKAARAADEAQAKKARAVDELKSKQMRAAEEAQAKKMRAAEELKARQGRAAEEAKAKAAAEEQRKEREAEARRKRADEETAKRDAERQHRDKEREEMRAKIAAQKKEYMERHQGAEEDAVQVQVQVPSRAAPVRERAATPPEPQMRAAGAPRPRTPSAPWSRSPPLADASPPPRAATPPPYVPSPPRAVTPDAAPAPPRQRRQWQNPMDDNGEDKGLGPAAEVEPQWRVQSPPSHLEPGAAAAHPPGAQRRNAPTPAPKDGAYYERKQKRLEEERAAREGQIREFQRQHFHEMREAAARNRRQIMGDIAGPAAAGAQLSPEPSGGEAAAEADDGDFAAMVKDMQDVLLQDECPEGVQAGAGAGAQLAGNGPLDLTVLVEGDEDGDDESMDDMQSEVLKGRFVLDGEVLQLPVQEQDPLGVKVEALRMFLEAKLGAAAFLKVYRRLESLTMDDDEAEVSREFMSALGPERLPYLQLVHQLIVCEEQWSQEAYR